MLGLVFWRRHGSRSQGRTPQGRAMIENLNSRFPIRSGLGRFAIPEWKKKQPDVERIARNILNKYSEKVNRKFRERN
jgi:hypothetical protein